jgi:hypothetical protein
VCNRTWLWLQKDGRELYAEDPTEFYQRVREAGQLFRGAVLGTMLDDEPRWFMDLGLHLERVGQIARILDVKYHMIGPTSRDKNEDVQTMATWVQLLLACGAYEHFFRQRNSTVRGYRVVDVLVFSRSSPRSILYGLLEMERTLGKPRILELYLNTVDWGPGLCGARAASRAYFGKRVTQLTPLEAAWLAGSLRAPHAAYQQQFIAGAPEHERARWVLQQMRSLPKAERERWARRPLALAAAKADAPALAGADNPSDARGRRPR